MEHGRQRASLSNDDLPDLVTESGTFEALIRRLRPLVDQLLPLNSDLHANVDLYQLRPHAHVF